MSAIPALKSKSQRSGWLTHLLVLAAIVLLGALLFGDIAWHPGEYLFSRDGDGIKNYYTAAWYVQHDRAWWFSGMNYPFGEHVIFTDNQPILAYGLAALRRQGVALNVVAVFNGLLLLAQLLSAPPLLALLRRCRLPNWYASITTVLIVLLAPQLERLLGHYALAYSCVIPMLWYLLVRATETGTRYPGRWYVAYGAFMLLTACLHPYYFAISALLLLAYSMVLWWQLPAGRLRSRRTLVFWARVLATLVLPAMLFQGGLLLTDPNAADRPSLPYGFFAYSSSVWSVFFPVEAPVQAWWQRIFHTPDPSWEGQAYVGIVATALTLGTLWRVGRRLRRRQWQRLRRPALPPVLRISLWAGFLVLLFSMGWPFRWGLEGLLNYLGPIRQFRSIGRFAWIFYYFYSVYAAYALYQGFRWLRQRPHWHRWAGPALAGCLLLWAAEGVFNAAHKAYQIQHPTQHAERRLPAAGSALVQYPQRLKRAGRSSSEFQAILPVPFYLVGSEVFTLFEGDESAYQSMRASLETGLPLATTMLSRTPLFQAQATGQLASNPAIDKAILARYPDRRPLLMVIQAKEPLDSVQRSLLARGHIFYRDSTVWLAELPLAKLEARPALLAEFERQRASLVAYAGYWASAPAPEVAYEGFNQPKAPPAFPDAGNIPPLLGAGAGSLRKGGFALLNQPMPRAGWYEASVWAYVRTADLPTLHASLLSASGTVLDSTKAETKASVDILGNWARLTVRLRVRQSNQRIRLWLRGRRIIFDEFELRPSNITVWRQNSPAGPLVRNNYPLIAPPIPVALPEPK
ncbi:hypothetical protein SAMN06265337_0689 [Hymenobacter gelipurpurascens]|uniref:DUF6311 domain-containing protein n=1 Tax=Hymenobacter gelipurpurascens TaxID=89968 RepID=A0A212T9N6_9BACT|nr:hypothetical protein [Hymenobacter gelipurpurascens]SNC62524.1 hypothetical protein SAMN06265337_0689 [Hymenobacter gelipurpurascens]